MIKKIIESLTFVGLMALSGVVFSDGLSPETIEGATTVSAEQAKALFNEEALFLDVRKDSDWTAGRVPGAVHLELKKVLTQESLAEEAGKSDKIVVYCNGFKCLRSAKASKKIVSWGYENVYYFRAGFPAWLSADYPVE